MDSGLPERLRRAFDANFAGGGELGAAVALWVDGEEQVSLAGGWTSKARDTAWTEQTLVPVYSASKGPAAACVLHALDTHGLEPDTAVARVWPGLAAHLSIGEILSHQGGLAALDTRAPVFNHAAVVAALEATVPAWTPPCHGYHPRTFGYLADEILRRVTGAASLGAYWREVIAGPREVDFWIGLPESEFGRVATLYPGRPDIAPEESAFYDAFNAPETMARRAFLSPNGLHSVAEMNTPAAWSAGLPGFGGVGSAAGLAKFYGLLATGKILSPRAMGWAGTRLVNGPDRVLLMPTAFSAGLMLDPIGPDGNKTRAIFGPSLGAFGHPGAGGSNAFADPEHRLGFAYVMNQMELSVLPRERVRRLVAAVYSG